MVTFTIIRIIRFSKDHHTDIRLKYPFRWMSFLSNHPKSDIQKICQSSLHKLTIIRNFAQNTNIPLIQFSKSLRSRKADVYILNNLWLKQYA